MKKWLSLIMALAMLVCMTACDAKPDDNENGTTTTTSNQVVQQDTIQTFLNDPANNGFVGQYYDAPENIKLSAALYDGAGIGVFGTTNWTEQEKQDVLAAAGWDAFHNPPLKLIRSDVENLVKDKLGLSLSEIKTKLEDSWCYIEKYDAYYVMHGDSNSVAISVVETQYDNNGVYTVKYTAPDAVTPTTGIVKLLKTDNGFQFLSNQKVTSVSIQPHLETAYAPYELYYFDCGIVTVATSDGFVMLDTEGKQIGEDSYSMLYRFGEDGRAKALLEPDGDWVWIDTTGAVVGTAEAPSTNDTTEKYSSEETQDGEPLIGIKDIATGEPITQPIFEWISSVSEPMNYATLAEGEHRKVMISPRGEVLVTLPDEAKDAYAVDAHVVCQYQDGSYRLLDIQGNVLSQTAFSSISDFSDGLAVMTVGNKMGLISTDGTIVVEPQIDIDAPANKCSPLICGKYIVCLKQEKVMFYKIV